MNLFEHITKIPEEIINRFLFKNIKFLSRRETLEYVLNNNFSISRFGDGELQMIFNRSQPNYKGIEFQKADIRLSEKLANILYKPIPHLLVCINHEFMKSNEYYVVLDYERGEKEYCRYESVHRNNDIAILPRKKQRIDYLKKYFTIRRKTTINCFGDATAFMLCFFYKEYVNKKNIEIIDIYRRFLSGKRILFVCPESPLMGLSFKQLLDAGCIKSAKSVNYFSIPAKNCFEHYFTIMSKILSNSRLDAVFIQAGPTATVMAAELAEKHGLLAYDVGSWNVSIQKAVFFHNISL